jgi:hypothetical protein
MEYFGGPILNKYNVEIHNIWWGSAWNSGTPSSDRIALQALYVSIINSDFFKGFWQYGGVKTPVIANNNVIHTATALPGATNVTFGQINACIDACVAVGQVPNYRNFGEPAMALNTMDYRHLYIVHVPSPKALPAGFNGASSVSLSVTPPHLVWYNWSAMNPAANHANPVYPFSARQMAAQAWAHEIIHHLESPWPGGDCTAAGSQGYSGWFYSHNAECGGSQHSLVGCGSTVRALTGTNACVARYWSDMDGKCIAPGTGDTWTRPP